MPGYRVGGGGGGYNSSSCIFLQARKANKPNCWYNLIYCKDFQLDDILVSIGMSNTTGRGLLMEQTMTGLDLLIICLRHACTNRAKPDQKRQTVHIN